MATVHSIPARPAERKREHPIWMSVFSERQRKTLISEDLAAGRVIPAILMGIMVFGFVSMILSVWLAL